MLCTRMKTNNFATIRTNEAVARAHTFEIALTRKLHRRHADVVRLTTPAERWNLEASSPAATVEDFRLFFGSEHLSLGRKRMLREMR